MSPYVFVVTWVLQALLLAAVLRLLPVMFRVRTPAMLTSWWQGAAFGVVVMPLVTLWLPRPTPGPAPVTTFVETTTVALTPALATTPVLPPAGWLGAIWIVGVIARLAWLVAGQRRLGRMAASGVEVNDDPALDRARALAPPPARPRLSARHVPVIAAADAAPCAFGWTDVRVLVPASLRTLPEDQRVTVYVHELAHVARADLGRAYADEAWRLLWWWQPAVWWALAHLRLAREHEVDRIVVQRTGGPRAYVDALLWCSTLRTAPLPNPQVGGSRHALVRRVALMCKGGEMSRTRRWTTAAGMVLAAGSVTGLVSVVSPLRAATTFGLQEGVTGPSDPGPLERQAVLPTLDAPAPRRTLNVEPVAGASPYAYRFRVHLVVDANGRVAEARIPQAVPAGVPEGEPTQAWATARGAVLDAVRQWQFEAPSRAPMLLLTDVVVGATAGMADHMERTQSSLDALAGTSRPALRVGGTIGPPKKVVDVPAVYPEAAKDAGVSGVVILEITVDREGSVEDARVVRSVPLLDAAALAAVRQWRYSPTLLNGAPVPVIMTVTISFTLSQ